MDAPGGLEQMIDAGGDIGVDTGVQVSQYQRLHRQVLLVDSTLCQVAVRVELALVDFPKVR